MSQKPLLVAVVGGSGSGKTWLCQKLCSAFGRRALRLSLDDFYRDRSHLSPARRALLNFDHPNAIDWDTFEKVLRDCLAARRTTAPQYDFKTHTRHRRRRIIRPRPVVFVDGLWLLRRAGLRKLFDVSIFLHCPLATRLKRRLARDLLNRGRSVASVREQFRRTVEPMHRRFVETQAQWAQMVFHRPVKPTQIAALAKLLQKQAGMINSTP